MENLVIKTEKKKQIVDITALLNKYLSSANFSEGLCHIFIKHTTSAITTADLDPGTDLDYLDAFEALMPKLNYRHPHNPEHVVDHILSSIIGPTVSVPVKGGELDLGQWQRVVLVELDGPRQREIIITLTSI